MEDDLVIRQRDIKVRKKWNIKPETKVMPLKTKKREKDNLRRQIEEEINEFE